MFGNKFAAEEIARDFKKQMDSKSQKKVASLNESIEKKVAQVSPEDFLVAPEEETDLRSQSLDSKIEEVSSYAKDEDDSCENCGKEHLAKDCDFKASKDSDLSYLIDRKAEYVLSELGKIAYSMKSEGNYFAADMVEVTANEIKDEALKVASEKIRVVSNLKKMASKAYDQRDFDSVKLIEETIEKIVS